MCVRALIADTSIGVFSRADMHVHTRVFVFDKRVAMENSDPRDQGVKYVGAGQKVDNIGGAPVQTASLCCKL